MYANVLRGTKHRRYIDWSRKDVRIFHDVLKIIATAGVGTNVNYG